MSHINYAVTMFEMKLLNRAVDDSKECNDDDNIEIKIESYFIREKCRSPKRKERRASEAIQRYENHPR